MRFLAIRPAQRFAKVCNTVAPEPRKPQQLDIGRFTYFADRRKTGSVQRGRNSSWEADVIDFCVVRKVVRWAHHV